MSGRLAAGRAAPAGRLTRAFPMKLVSAATALSAALLLGACANLPKGPGVMALPGTGKSPDQFRYDDEECRQFADAQIGGSSPSDVANSTAAKSAVVGTVIGAAVGAAFGGYGGAAAVGAGFGLLTGAAVGASAGESSAYSLQRRYDQAYIQCMYTRGHKVPVSGRLSAPPPRYIAPPPPPAPNEAPPPPPGTPPPPPRSE